MKKCWNSVKKFVKNQVGANTLEVVLILALAGIAGVGIYSLGKNIFKWGNTNVDGVTAQTDYTVTNSN